LGGHCLCQKYLTEVFFSMPGSNFIKPFFLHYPRLGVG
jgi:hypothetical protein